MQHFNDIILSIEGAKYITKGVNILKTKLDIESLIKAPWVFLYTAQKQVTAYQWNTNTIKVKI